MPHPRRSDAPWLQTRTIDLTAGPSAGFEPALDLAAAALLRGEAVVLPTDTVYGLAALPSVPGATATLSGLKERAPAQALAVLVSDIDQGLGLVACNGDDDDRPAGATMLRSLLRACWPGALTVVALRSAASSGFELGGDPATIGVRCPDEPFVRALARRVGPLATTSANRHGAPTPLDASAAAATLAGQVALVVDGGPRHGTPSTVVDLTGGEPRVLRQGGVSLAAVRAALGA